MIKNPNKRKIINLSVVLLLCILFIISLILNNKSNNNELLSTTESLVTKQTNIEKNITSKGYTKHNTKSLRKFTLNSTYNIWNKRRNFPNYNSSRKR